MSFTYVYQNVRTPMSKQTDTSRLSCILVCCKTVMITAVEPFVFIFSLFVQW